MRGLTDGRIHGGWALRQDTGVAPVTAEQSIHCVENCDVHNSHCPARAPRPELFAEHSILPRGNRCMIEAGRVNRDLIPPVNRVEPLLRGLVQVNGLRCTKARTERVAKVVSASVGDSGETKRESKKERRG